MANIKTREDWWKTVTAYWQDFLVCGGFVGMGAAPQILTAKQQNDWVVIYQYLQEIWMRAPDSPKIHSWPSWHHLCDCCSEVWVFEEVGG